MKSFEPYKQYKTFLSDYSIDNQEQSNIYKDIIESETSEAYYNKEYPSLEAASNGRLNSNIPVYKGSETIFVDKKPINVYKQFWQYKQNGGSIFTDYTSAGVSNNLEDLSVRNLPLKSMGLDKSTPQLVLSNTNNVRNNMQNYGKTYLLTQNLLNSQAFDNGIYYQSNSTSSYRPVDTKESFGMSHSNFANKEEGDKFYRQNFPMRVDLPSNYAQTLLSSWQTVNPSFISPNLKEKNDHIIKMKFGTFNLDALIFVGKSCLTKDFSVIPPGFDKPVDVFSDDMNYPPLSNSNYFNQGPDYFKKTGISDGLFCSSNSNYIAVPINYKYPELDTSINFSPGNNSVPVGMIMSPALKQFINQDLYNLNKLQILRCLKKQYSNDPNKLNSLMKAFPEIKNDPEVDYNFFNENEKYTYIYNQQRSLHDLYHNNPQVSKFTLGLVIFKLGGLNPNNSNNTAKVMFNNTTYELTDDTGVFLLLPSMLSEDVFNLKENSEGFCEGKNLKEKSVSCCFQGPAGSFNPNSTYYPSFDSNDPILTNMVNPGCGPNPYNAPSTF